MADAFIKLVKKCRTQKLDHMIQNAAREHALVLFNELIESATDDGVVDPIRIVSGHLDDNFYSKLVPLVEKYISNSGSNIEVIVLDPNFDKSANSFAQTVDRATNGSLHVLSEDIYSELKSHAHFIIIGNNKFRYETDHDQTKATASFNNASIGGTIMDIFNRLHNIITRSDQVAAL